MGAGHCQWGGFTDRNVCNIHGEEHLASHLHVKNQAPRFIACSRRACYTRKEGRKARKYIMMWDCKWRQKILSSIIMRFLLFLFLLHHLCRKHHIWIAYFQQISETHNLSRTKCNTAMHRGRK